jgi:hypothetical protein
MALPWLMSKRANRFFRSLTVGQNDRLPIPSAKNQGVSRKSDRIANWFAFRRGVMLWHCRG